jgi:hypothetical protein
MKSLLFLFLLSLPARASVRTERVPEGGVQPQIAAGADGALHLVYLKGTPGGCDVRYATKRPGSSAWGGPLTVNSEPHTAVSIGTIRGAQVALGKDGTVHVVWNGPGSKDKPSSLFYTRKAATASAFEPQRNLRADTRGLDGGASIAAGTKGEVYIIWHGARKNVAPGELNRVVFVLKSSDNGATFTPVKIANAEDAGVCACCSVKSFVSADGEVYSLYRAARKLDQRDVTLLTSTDGGASFQHRIVGPWAINACPMSSMSLTSQGTKVRGAWEAEGKVFTSLLDGPSQAVAVSEGKARHPTLAVNSKGETLVAWSVGTGWEKGGSLGWRILDAGGKPTGETGTATGVPVWGMAAAYAEGDGFVVMF